jgi:hypothetical protein
MTNYWSTKTQIWENNDNQKDLIAENYDALMNNLYGHIFAQFLAEIGLTAKDANKFLIDAVSYINDHEEKFDT